MLELAQLLHVPQVHPQFDISPDGTRLAYVLDIDGGESYHLVVFDPSTNTHTDLTPNISHALQPNFCWSPDGKRLAFLSDEHEHVSARDKLVELGKMWKYFYMKVKVMSF